MWDWDLVGELIFGISIGIALGGYAFVQLAKAASYELLSHPTARRLANAADKFAGKTAGGVGGFLKDLLLGEEEEEG